MIKFKAGTYKKQLEYQSFVPSLVNRSFIWEDKKIDVLNSEAMRLLGELNAYAVLVPDVNFFIQMNVVREAIASNMIEGTQTGVDEIVLSQEEINPERRDDWSEVQNYIKAINFSIDRLHKLPLSVHLLKETHKILLSGVRGKYKTPGVLRKSQNWIGGSSLSDAFFIPPAWEEVPDLLNDLEKFWHNKQIYLPILIKTAITHYQFETIHPFLDGNGRLGRLLVVLQLIDAQTLIKPTLYLSAFFEKNKASYYNALTMARETSNLEQWVKFFLNGIIHTAKDGVEVFKQIVLLRQEYDVKITALGIRTKNAQKLLLSMFSSPIVSTKRVEKNLGISFSSANRLLKSLVDLKILKEMTGFSRNRLFVLNEYLELFKK